MALIPCPDCGRQVSTEATACPECGRPIRLPRAAATAVPGDSFPEPVLVRPQKSRGAYIILGLFLGCLGIHNFYAGYYGRGAAQVIITLTLGWILIGFFITGIWALIEIITVTEDGKGNPMS